MASQISTFSPYNDGSVGSFLFDGFNYIALRDNLTAFQPGTGAFTLEFWVFLNNISSNDYHTFFDSRDAGDEGDSFFFGMHGSASPSGMAYFYTDSSDYRFGQNQILHNKVWHHLALVRTSTGSGGMQLYLDGVGGTAMTVSNDFTNTNNSEVLFGQHVGSTAYNFYGYMSDIRFVKGTAVYTGNFTPPSGKLTTTGGTYQSTTNVNTSITASHTTFLAQPGNNVNLNRDTAAPEEAIIPAYNSARIPAVTSITYTNDNTTASITTGTAAYTQYYSNAKFPPSSGKYYFEARLTAPPVSSPAFSSAGAIGFLYTPFEDGTRSLGQSGSPAGEFALALSSGNKMESGSPSASYSSGFTNNQVFQFALDTESGSIWFGRDGTWLESGNPTTGANPTYTGANANALFFGIQGYAATNYGGTSHLNMGQNPTFNGTESPSGGTNSDGSYPDISGIGSFLYEPPTGYKAPSTLVPTRASGLNNAALAPNKHFDTLLYVGNATDNHRIRGLNFKPDFVWGFGRDASPASGHWMYDSVRGATKQTEPNGSNAESTQPTMLKAFNVDGFDMGTDTAGNKSSTNFVAWCWKAGGESVVNTDGTITSMVSANKDAGFSIVCWTGTDAAGTIGHGLSKAPELMWVKPRSTANSWVHYDKVFGGTHYMALQTTQASSANSSRWNDTSPNSKVFSVGSHISVSDDGNKHIGYLWHSVEGYSKIGSFEGNNDPNGTFVYLGFKPAWLIVKNADTTHDNHDWIMFDNKRHTNNEIDLFARANEATAETTSGRNVIDFLSNGFKARSSYGDFNSTETYIYMAFAETPSAFTNSE